MQTNPQKFCEHKEFVRDMFAGNINGYDIKRTVCPFCPRPQPPSDWLREIIEKWHDDNFEGLKRGYFHGYMSLTKAIRDHIREHMVDCVQVGVCPCCKWWEKFLGISERKDGGE